jgi:hypothetical protein
VTGPLPRYTVEEGIVAARDVDIDRRWTVTRTDGSGHCLVVLTKRAKGTWSAPPAYFCSCRLPNERCQHVAEVKDALMRAARRASESSTDLPPAA